MIIEIIAFFCGDLCGLSLYKLPAWYWLVLPIVLCAVLYWVLRRYRGLIRLFLFAMLGLAWLVVTASMLLHSTLPKNWEGKNLTIIAKIVSIPTQEGKLQTFLVKPDSLQFANEKIPWHALIKLNVYNQTLPVQVGESWQLQVRLKRPHSLINPGGNDYEAWLLQRHIRALGYVVVSNDAANKRVATAGYHQLLNQLRSALVTKMQLAIGNVPYSAMISGLTVGLREGITAPQWQVLQNTGTNHLMAIAGLHVGFVTGFVYAFIAWGWRRLKRLPEIIPAPQAAATAGLIAAISYCALAGFALPTQRALVMISVFLLTQILKRHVPAWQSYFLALFIVLLCDPLAPLSLSFWLSFAAVGIILYGMRGRLAVKRWWWKWGRAQWVVTVGLLPICLWFFQQSSIISIFANVVAIPWIGFIVVPLALIGCIIILIWSWLGKWILWLACKSFQIMWYYLQYLSNLPDASWHHAVANLPLLILAMLGVLILLAPRGWPARSIGIILLLPMLFYHQTKPTIGNVKLTLLDVGQGLSAIIQTQQHTLIFDTGPAFPNGNNMGNEVLLPYFRYQGITSINMMIISHADLDHRGGAQAVLQGIPVRQVFSSAQNVVQFHPIIPCLAGESWQWDGVAFQFLYPMPNNNLNSRNDNSCVLKITDGKAGILLTGDIEKPSEHYLVQQAVDNLAATIIVAPHHGSNTSSSLPFIKAVSPSYVLYPVGYRNKFHFPNKPVVRRYQQLGVIQMNTADDGAIILQLNSRGLINQPISWRKQHWHFWYQDY